MIRNTKSRGYATAVNQGIASVESDLVLLLDCDAYLTSNAAAAARQMFADQPDLGVIGFTLADELGQPTGSYEPEPTGWSLALGQRLSSKWLVPKPGRGLVVYSCAMVIRRKCFVELQGFDEGFDFLDADIDFSMRVNRSPWQLVAAAPGLCAIHQGGGSPQETCDRVVRHYTNRKRLLLKHSLLRFPQLARCAVIVRCSAELCAAWLATWLSPSERWTSVIHSRRRILREFLFNFRVEAA